MFCKEERLALFIDGANLHGAARALAFDVDFGRLFNVFAKRGRLIRAFYYNNRCRKSGLLTPAAVG